MRKALHPYENRKISVSEFILEFGRSHSNSPEKALCPICGQSMSIVAASSPCSVGHFSHLPKSDFCPTKIKSSAQYSKLYPQNPDPGAAKRMQRTFSLSWQKHFYHLNSLVKGLSCSEFIDVLKLANKARIWEYAKLEEYQLPYIFSTLKDFHPKDSFLLKDKTRARKCYFRCWFDSSVQRYDDLWIHRSDPVKFWRAWYHIDENKRSPSISDMIDAYGSELESAFLLKDVYIYDFIEKKISSWISENFHIL